MTYTKKEQKLLLDTAKESIQHGLSHHSPLPLNLKKYSDHLKELRAIFITLSIKGNLRGCIGSLQSNLPLIKSVSHYAFAAAFEDFRFSPLHSSEFFQLEVSISILTPPTPVSFKSEEELLMKIEPFIDGLILKEGSHCGTFLPSVWEELPNPKEFLNHLKRKAGLDFNYWSNTMQIEKYRTEVIK